MIAPDGRAPVSQRAALRIRSLRQAKFASLAEAIRCMDASGYSITSSTIYQRERGRHRMDLEELVAWANLLDVEPGELIRPHACHHCLDVPPPGFICRECRAEGTDA